MERKIFINIFFEKKNILLVYISVITLFTIFLGIQTIFFGNQLEQSIYPDMELYGAPDEDGVMRYKLYNDIGDVPDKLEKELESGVRFQNVILRNLLTVSDNFNIVEYRVCGMDNQDIKLLEKNIKSGQIPKTGEKGVLLGSYAARYFNVDVGDKMEIKISLDKDNMGAPEGEYYVSGILNDNMQFYKGSIIVSKETWSMEHQEVKDNMLYLYIDNDEAYKNVVETINRLDEPDTAFINIMNNYDSAATARNSIISNILVICVISLIVIVLLFFFLMRGMVKKIGLLKALGLPEKIIIKIFCGGLLMITISAILISFVCEYGVVLYMNMQAAEFYGFEVQAYSVNKYAVIAVLALNLVNMIASASTVIWYGKKVSPREAMLKI